MQRVRTGARAMRPLYVIELDLGGSTVTWEFYEDGVRFEDGLEGVIEWAPLWEYVLE